MASAIIKEMSVGFILKREKRDKNQNKKYKTNQTTKGGKNPKQGNNVQVPQTQVNQACKNKTKYLHSKTIIIT